MEKLQDLMVNSGLTLSEVSKLSNVSVSTVHRYVKGNVKEINKAYYDPILKVLQEAAKEKNKSNSSKTNSSDDKQSSEHSHNAIVNKNTDNCVNTQVISQENKQGFNVDELKQQMLKNTVNSSNLSHTTLLSSTNMRNDNNEHLNIVPHRGEIWYVKGNNVSTGKELWSGTINRPCVVIQNNKLLNTGTIVVAFLTKQHKEQNPTLVQISLKNVVSTVLCGQLCAISQDRFHNIAGKVSDIEMSLIERAILTTLDIKINPKSEIQYSADFLSLKKELEIYKKFYEDYVKVQSIKHM